MKPFERITNPREIRRRLRLNQQEFWSRIGVTQSGGSRYESGRTMPKPVRELLRLVHIEGIELDKARGSDFEVATYLKRANPKLYQNLRKAASGTGSSGRVASSASARSHRASRITRKR
jgi:transcriptional regulator with XRE-family HTH domain